MYVLERRFHKLKGWGPRCLYPRRALDRECSTFKPPPVSQEQEEDAKPKKLEQVRKYDLHRHRKSPQVCIHGSPRQAPHYFDLRDS